MGKTSKEAQLEIRAWALEHEVCDVDLVMSEGGFDETGTSFAVNLHCPTCGARTTVMSPLVSDAEAEEGLKEAEDFLAEVQRLADSEDHEAMQALLQRLRDSVRTKRH